MAALGCEVLLARPEFAGARRAVIGSGFAVFTPFIFTTPFGLPHREGAARALPPEHVVVTAHSVFLLLVFIQALEYVCVGLRYCCHWGLNC
jgi:hypothetical protein